MSEPVVCENCSVAYGGDLTACPWCGHPQPTDATVEPSEPGTDAAEHGPMPPAEIRTSEGSSRPGPETALPASPEESSSVLAPRADEYLRRRARRRRLARRIGTALALIVLGAVLAEVVPIRFPERETAAAGLATEDTAPPLTVATPDGADPIVDATVPTVAPSPEIVPGEPLDGSDLVLGAGGIGPLEFGLDAETVFGRLVATLGPPSFDSGFISAPDAASGLCAGATIRELAWGPFEVYAELTEDGVAEFRSYRMKAPQAEGEVSLPTVSGISVGNLQTDLAFVYADFDVTIDELAFGPGYEIRSPDDGRLLLWGTVSGIGDNDIVTSINSPLRCEG